MINLFRRWFAIRQESRPVQVIDIQPGSRYLISIEGDNKMSLSEIEKLRSQLVELIKSESDSPFTIINLPGNTLHVYRINGDYHA